MDIVMQGKGTLLNRFREFYGEIIALKSHIQSETWVPKKDSDEKVEESNEPESDLLVHSVWKRLLHLLEQQELAVSRGAGEYVYELYKSSQFVMAALADEIFLQMDWEGRDAWQSKLLETKLFHTSAAGGLFFEKLDTLLQHRDPIHLELAKVYLMALALGFKGKYRGEEKESVKLAFYRKELFSFIFRHSPELGDGSKRFCPQAYAHSLEEGLGLKLAYPQRWFVLLGLLVVGMIFLSHGTWVHLTEGLTTVINETMKLK